MLSPTTSTCLALEIKKVQTKRSHKCEATSKFSIINDSIKKFTVRIEDKINNFLRKIKNLKLIEESTYKKLFVSGSSPGILYGLPKIHKANFSIKFQFRPIFAAYNIPSYNLAKFLVPILNPYTTNQYTVTNSYSFANELKQINNAKNYYMASCDIESLYTNIPLSETIDIILSLLFKHPTDTFIGLSKNLFKTLLELSVFNCFFKFNGKYYKQCDGLGMGLPHSPTFANLFLSYHEIKWLDSCPKAFKPSMYRRYIDDTFLLFRDQSHVQLFLDFLNDQHVNIKFTCETENNNKLAFLDCSVCKDSDKFECSVYRKDSFTGLGNSFYSFCSYSFKLNGIATLINRVFNVCTTYKLFDYEINFLRNYFNDNGFTSGTFYRIVNKFLHKKFSVNNKPAEFNKDLIYVAMPYFGVQSEQLKKDLFVLICKFFPNLNIKIILVNKFTIGSLFNYKEKLNDCMRSNVIYKFSCANCASDYIGMTSRNLFIRICEHAGISFRTNLVLSQPPYSAVREHARSCNNIPNQDHFKIIDSSNNSLDLKLLESLHIQKLKPSLNNTLSSQPLLIV